MVKVVSLPTRGVSRETLLVSGYIHTEMKYGPKGYTLGVAEKRHGAELEVSGLLVFSGLFMMALIGMFLQNCPKNHRSVIAAGSVRPDRWLRGNRSVLPLV